MLGSSGSKPPAQGLANPPFSISSDSPLPVPTVNGKLRNVLKRSKKIVSLKKTLKGNNGNMQINTLVLTVDFDFKTLTLDMVLNEMVSLLSDPSTALMTLLCLVLASVFIISVASKYLYRGTILLAQCVRFMKSWMLHRFGGPLGLADDNTDSSVFNSNHINEMRHAARSREARLAMLEKLEMNNSNELDQKNLKENGDTEISKQGSNKRKKMAYMANLAETEPEKYYGLLWKLPCDLIWGRILAYLDLQSIATLERVNRRYQLLRTNFDVFVRIEPKRPPLLEGRGTEESNLSRRQEISEELVYYLRRRLQNPGLPYETGKLDENHLIKNSEQSPLVPINPQLFHQAWRYAWKYKIKVLSKGQNKNPYLAHFYQ